MEQDPHSNAWKRGDVRAVTVHVAQHYKIDLFALYLCGALLGYGISKFNKRLNWKEYAESMEKTWRLQDEDAQKRRVRNRDPLDMHAVTIYQPNPDDDAEQNGEYEDIEAPRVRERNWGPIPPLQGYGLLRNVLFNTGIGLHRAARWVWTAAATAVNAVRNNHHARNLATAARGHIGFVRQRALQVPVRAPLAFYGRSSIRTGLGLDEVDVDAADEVPQEVLGDDGGGAAGCHGGGGGEVV